MLCIGGRFFDFFFFIPPSSSFGESVWFVIFFLHLDQDSISLCQFDRTLKAYTPISEAELPQVLLQYSLIQETGYLVRKKCYDLGRAEYT